MNDYLRLVTDEEITAKDFRTWFGSRHVLQALSECPPCTTQSEGKKNVVEAIRLAASKLGNTPAICRNSYVHPYILLSATCAAANGSHQYKTLRMAGLD